MEEQMPRDHRPATNGHPVPDLLNLGGDPAPPPQTPTPSSGTDAPRRFPRLRPDLFALRGLAALGAAGLFASLVTAWQRIDIPLTDPQFGAEQIEPIPVPLGQLGVVAFGYLGAAIALAGCAALVLFGRPSGRGQPRVLGLAMAGAALAAAAALLLGGDTEQLSFGAMSYSASGVDVRISTQSGAWFGIGGTVLLALAVYLVPRDAAPVAEAGPGGDPDAGEWRQPVVPRHADERPAAPLDLSVEPVEPFRHVTDERREPWR